MTPDFALNQLVSIYIKDLSGVILSRKHKMHLPVYQVYEDVMNILYMKNDEGVEVFKSAREKILGKEYLKAAPPDYWDTLTAMDLGYDLDTWEAMSFRSKAKILATRHIKSMIDIITSYYDEMDERMKNNAKN